MKHMEKKMKKMGLCRGWLLAALGAGGSLAPAYAAGGSDEAHVALEWSADVVSSYVWRGTQCAGFSVQPDLTVSWPRTGLSVGVWASAELFESRTFANMTEFDLTGSYAVGGLTASLTDYFFCDERYLSSWTFSAASAHRLEASLAYDFGPVALSWNTCLTGPDHSARGKRLYSTYIEASAPFTLGGVECMATVGGVPWEVSPFLSGSAAPSRRANVVNCSLAAQRVLKGLPLMGQVIYNPYTEAVYFVVGLHF